MERITSRILQTTLICGSVLLANNAIAATEIYGKAHVSFDSVDTGSTNDVGISSNSTRIGFKGESDMERSWRSIWKLESQVDLTGEDISFTPRNRYIGLQAGAGTLLIGTHDTPMKDLGSKFDMFTDSVGDSRAVRGTDATGQNRFDRRPYNAALYISPEMAGFELRMIGSPGTSVDETNPLLGGSLVYTGEMIWGGLAFERLTDSASSTEITGYRGAAGILMGTIGLNVIGEYFDDSQTGSTIDRLAYGGNVKYGFGALTFKVQIMLASTSDVGNDGVTQWAAGINQRLGKDTDIYFMMTGIKNGDSATYGIGSYHGDQYAGTAGKTLSAYSVGVEQRF